MAAQTKTRQKKAIVTSTVSKEALLDMVANGRTLDQIAEYANGIVPGLGANKYYICKTLQQWPEEYSQAKKVQAEMHASKVAELADKVETGQLDPASARVSSDNRRWLASKLDPATYGDRVAIDAQITDVAAMHIAAMKEAMKVVSG